MNKINESQNSLPKFPMMVNDFQLLELLSQTSWYLQEDISEIWDFYKKETREVSKHHFDSLLINIDTHMKRKILKGINTLSQYTSKSKEEIMDILGIDSQKLNNQMLQDGEIMLSVLDAIHQDFIQLYRDIARFYFENKYYWVSYQYIFPHLTQEEKEEYIKYYEDNREKIDQEKRNAGYISADTSDFFKRYNQIREIFANRIDSILEAYHNQDIFVFNYIIDEIIKCDIGEMSLYDIKDVKWISHLWSIIWWFLQKYEESQLDLKKFRISQIKNLT